MELGKLESSYVLFLLFFCFLGLRRVMGDFLEAQNLSLRLRS